MYTHKGTSVTYPMMMRGATQSNFPEKYNESMQDLVQDSRREYYPKKFQEGFIPIQKYSSVETYDRRVREVMSPRLAAIGVATLSGLMLQCLESTMTAAVIKPR